VIGPQLGCALTIHVGPGHVKAIQANDHRIEITARQGEMVLSIVWQVGYAARDDVQLSSIPERKPACGVTGKRSAYFAKTEHLSVEHHATIKIDSLNAHVVKRELRRSSWRVRPDRAPDPDEDSGG